MNLWIFVGLFCVQISNHAIKTMDSNTNVFTIHYEDYSIYFSKPKYNEFIDCLCHSNNSSATFVLISSGKRKQVGVTESVKCEIGKITTEKLSLICIVTHTKISNDDVDISIQCNTNVDNLYNTIKDNLFNIKCENKCFGIDWQSHGPLNVTYNDPDTIDIHKFPCFNSQPEPITTLTSSVDITTVNYSDIGSSSNVSQYTSNKNAHSNSIISYVMSGIFIGCVISFILGVKRISLHSHCLTHVCWVYNKLLKRDTDYIRRDNYQEQTFRDSCPQATETLDQMIDNHTAIWHRETDAFEWRSNGGTFEQETTLNNILVDRIYAVPQIPLNVVNALNSETEISENQNHICNETPVQTTLQHQDIHRGAECKHNVSYCEVEIQPTESDITIETYLKTPAECNATKIVSAEKVYETPSPVIDEIYFTLRRKCKFFKHNYERIPPEVEAYHANLEQDEPSRSSTFYEIELAEEGSSRQMIHSAIDFAIDDSHEFIFDEEIPIFSVYSSLRQKRRYKHNYEVITSVLDTLDTDKGGHTLPHKPDQIDAAKDVLPTNESEVKGHNCIKFMIKNDKETNIYSDFKDFSRSLKPNVMNYNGLELLDTSCNSQNELDFYLQKGSDAYEFGLCPNLSLVMEAKT